MSRLTFGAVKRALDPYFPSMIDRDCAARAVLDIYPEECGPGDLPRGVALLGRAGSGKSTLACALVERGAMDRVESFAGELKADLATLGVHKGMTGFREVAIAYGTKHKRAISPGYWIERLDAKMHGDLDGCVIDDVRFPDEVAFLRDRGFLVVKLACDAKTRIERGIAESFAITNDESETACDGIRPDLYVNTSTQGVEECVSEVLAALAGVPA